VLIGNLGHFGVSFLPFFYLSGFLAGIAGHLRWRALTLGKDASSVNCLGCRFVLPPQNEDWLGCFAKFNQDFNCALEIVKLFLPATFFDELKSCL